MFGGLGDWRQGALASNADVRFVLPGGVPAAKLTLNVGRSAAGGRAEPVALAELDLHGLLADPAGLGDLAFEGWAASASGRAVAGQIAKRAIEQEDGAALLALCGVECLPQLLGVAAGEGSEPFPGRVAAISRRSGEETSQVSRWDAVGLGEAGDEGVATFPCDRPDLEGELGDRLAVRAGLCHGLASVSGLPGRLRREAISRSTASRPALVIFSVPVRMASTAAPRS